MAEGTPINVYCVTCAPTGKQYIGISCKSIQNRWARHVRDAVIHMRGWALAGAIRKYGPENFSIETAYVAVDEREARMVERGLIAERGTLVPSGYNLTTGGERFPRLKYTQERCAAISVQRKALNLKASAETRAKMSASQRGQKRSAEARARMSAKARGRKVSPEGRLKMSMARKGKAIITRETALKIAESLRGRKQSPELIEKRRLAIKAAPNLNRDKTHCPQGHEYTSDNTRFYDSGRQCCACVRMHKRNYRLRRLKARPQLELSEAA